MKYIITESQFDNIILSHLNNQNFIKLKKGRETFFLYKPDDLWAAMKYDSHGLLIHDDLTYEISSMFSISEEDAEIVIRDWVSKEIGKKIDVWDVKTLGGMIADANLSVT